MEASLRIASSDSLNLDYTTANNSCAYYNSTNRLFLTTYEGIPQTLILNVFSWGILLILFTFLRKRAWNYGRIALVQKNESTYKWTQLFYGTLDEVTGMSENDSSSLTSLDSSIYYDRGFCSWITSIFRIRKEEILQKCGPDALQYLSFQKHIIFLMVVMMIISISVVLPVNFQGELEGDETSFGHTTVSNLNPNSPFLWIHVTLAILYLPLAIFVMRRFSIKAKIQEIDVSSSKTLMITNIPRAACDSVDIRTHFSEAYPEVEVQDITLAFDIAKVSLLDKEREKMYQAKQYCENYWRRTRVKLDMRPYACGNICVCCDVLGCAKVDAIEFYTKEEERLVDEVDSERARALRRPLGICFVTFTTVQDAQAVLSDLRPPCTPFGGCVCSEGPSSSTLSQRLKPGQWQAALAPVRSDIFWENLSVRTKHWYLRALLINALLFIVLFFLTTPAFVVNLVNTLPLTNKIQQMNPLLSQFLPTLLLWTVAALLPVLVSYSDQWVSHWTRSEQNHSIMRKTFSFLLFMVIILPSIGLTSAQALVEWWMHWNNEKYRWECLFLPDKGAFFVNYVITSALIGTGLELIRFPELFMYTMRLCLARSEAETVNVRRTILWEFPFGVQYAWMLLIFALTTIYSLSCPLITVFGVLYMVLKHMVDKYNLYFAYGTSKINQKIHETAINIVILSVVLLQASFLVLSLLRQGLNNITIYSLVGFSLTILFFFFNIFFSICKGFSPIIYQGKREASAASSPAHGFSRHRFIPEVLEPQTSEPRSPSVPMVIDREPQTSYGTGDFGITNSRLYQGT